MVLNFILNKSFPHNNLKKSFISVIYSPIDKKQPSLNSLINLILLNKWNKYENIIKLQLFIINC